MLGQRLQGEWPVGVPDDLLLCGQSPEQLGHLHLERVGMMLGAYFGIKAAVLLTVCVGQGGGDCVGGGLARGESKDAVRRAFLIG